MLTKQRDTTLDALKALAIFFVCWGHCIQYSVEAPFTENPIWLFIYSFHMPLFMCLVGYFSTSLLNYSTKDAIFKRFRELILPSITFTTIYVLGGFFEANSLKRFIALLIYNFWFLKSAFLCSLLFVLSAKSKRIRLAGLTFSYILCLFIGGYWFINAMFPCFLLGYILRIFNEKVFIYKKFILFSAIAVFAFMYQFYGTEVYKAAWNFSLTGDIGLWQSYSIKLILGLSASVGIFCIFRILENNKLMKSLFNSLSTIGTRTLGIYLLQTLVIEVLLSKVIVISGHYSDSSVIIIPILIATSLLPILAIMVRLIERHKITALFMLGKKRDTLKGTTS